MTLSYYRMGRAGLRGKGYPSRLSSQTEVYADYFRIRIQLARLGVESRDSSDHEFVEQRNRESHVPVRGAKDHAFLDELGPHGPEAGDFDSQLIGDGRQCVERPA